MVWYYKLEQLYKSYNVGPYALIISKEVQHNGNTIRQFSVCDNHMQFYEIYCEMPFSQRVLYEVIRGDSSQKLYFDIDIKKSELPKNLDHEQIIKDLKTAIKTRTNCDDTSIMVFNSNYKESTKISYHIILDRMYVKSHKHNKKICMDIAGMVSPLYRPFIDCLYSSLQQFRMLGSHKLSDPNRTKKIDDDLSEWVHRGREECHNRDMMCASFIAHITNSTYIVVELPKENPVKTSSCELINIDDLSEIIRTSLKCFTIRKFSDGIYTLTRIRRDVECIVCNRVHESETGFVYVLPDGSVIFRCFRNRTRSQVIGSIDANLMMPETKEREGVQNNPTEKNTNTSAIPSPVVSDTMGKGVADAHNMLRSAANSNKGTRPKFKDYTFARLSLKKTPL